MTPETFQKPDCSPEAEARRNQRFEVRGSSIQGRGGFAVDRFRADEVIAEYKGELISREEVDRRLDKGNPFIFVAHETLIRDGDIPGNPAQYLNHSCAPNCRSFIFEDQIWIVAERDIEPGEELTYDYGYTLDGHDPIACHCGAPDCFRFILAKQHRWPLPPLAND
jgi:hypothetical protein